MAGWRECRDQSFDSRLHRTPGAARQAAGIFFANGQPKPSYTAFRFPFVTERIDKRRLRAWGKAPSGGKLVIQRRARGRWVATKKIKVSQGSVFTAKLPLRGKQRCARRWPATKAWSGSRADLYTPGVWTSAIPPRQP